MKNPKKLTRTQKEMVSAHGLNAEHWSLVQEMEFYLRIINKQTGQTRMIDKFRKSKR